MNDDLESLCFEGNFKAYPMLEDLVTFGQVSQLTILLKGEAGSGKSTYAEAYLAQGLSMGFPAIFLTTDVSPRQIEHDMSRFGWRISKCIENGAFRFIDGFSGRMGGRTRSRDIGFYNLDDVNELSIVISQALEGLVCARIVIDSLSTIMLHSDPNVVFRSLQALSGKLKQDGHSLVIILEEGVHDNRVMNMFSFFVDAIMEFKQKEDANGNIIHLVRLGRTRGSDAIHKWVEFKV